jgi:RNA polymerase sigma factor (sigma-70 family)
MDIFHNYQKKLFPYAYNILGSVDDAYDVIQDVIVNFIESDRDGINNESAYLITSVVNKSINLKKRHQKTIGDLNWLPEPIATENADHAINTKEIISYSILVLLELLNPKERAVFILKIAFDYSHQKIAEILSISVDNSKQLLSRAKKTLKDKGSDLNLNSKFSKALLLKYVDIIKSGNVKKLEEMLSDNIITRAGGGGKAGKAVEVTAGINAVALLLVRSYERYLNKFDIEFKDVNNSPAALFYKGGKLLGCQIFDINTETNKITNIYFIAGRKKLQRL